MILFSCQEHLHTSTYLEIHKFNIILYYLYRRRHSVKRRVNELPTPTVHVDQPRPTDGTCTVEDPDGKPIYSLSLPLYETIGNQDENAMLHKVSTYTQPAEPTTDTSLSFDSGSDVIYPMPEYGPVGVSRIRQSVHGHTSSAPEPVSSSFSATSECGMSINVSTQNQKALFNIQDPESGESYTDPEYVSGERYNTSGVRPLKAKKLPYAYSVVNKPRWDPDDLVLHDNPMYEEPTVRRSSGVKVRGRVALYSMCQKPKLYPD